MINFYALARPVLFMFPPEKAHALTLKLMKMGLMPSFKAAKDSALESTLFGLKFPNPVGMSAGFDKNAEVVGASFNMGFGFVEVGTVTPKPQEGNPSPRIFRDPANDAVINRMGFPNGGMADFKENLERFLSRKSRPSGVVGLNIGMNKAQSEPAKDYATLIRMLGPMADYITINISSPNTPGLRDLQKREPLLALIAAVKDAREKACGAHPPPLLVKLAPDLDEGQQAEMAETLLEAAVDGVILGNTTLDRPAHLPEEFRTEAGGLSGQPLTDKSTGVIANFYKLTGGKLPIIGVGGISNGAQAYDKIKAGASLVQLYTALVFKGPTVVGVINAELLALLKADGYSNVAEAVGADHKDGEKGQHAA